jgi:L-fuculose-phosphate aldolase
MDSYQSYLPIQHFKNEKDFLIQDIIFTGKVLYRENLVNSHAGNISVRIGNNLLIKKTGRMLGFLTEDDIIELPIFENTDKDKIASRELIVHREIYKKTDAKAVIHAHPINAVALTFILNNYFVPIDSEGELFVGKVPILKVKKPSGSEELAKAVPEIFNRENTNYVLVKTHGSFVKADSLNNALRFTSDLEYCAKIYNLVKNLK